MKKKNSILLYNGNRKKSSRKKEKLPCFRRKRENAMRRPSVPAERIRSRGADLPRAGGAPRSETVRAGRICRGPEALPAVTVESGKKRSERKICERFAEEFVDFYEVRP